MQHCFQGSPESSSANANRDPAGAITYLQIVWHMLNSVWQNFIEAETEAKVFLYRYVDVILYTVQPHLIHKEQWH